MIGNLVTSPSIELLERTLNFTEQRHQLIVQNIANVDVPGYVQQEASVADFQGALAKAIEGREENLGGDVEPESTGTVGFVPGGTGVYLKPKGIGGPAAHDRGVRSSEMLMADLADNAVAHNMAATMLRQKYETIRSAISLKA
jgi:flagellar basal body rod protein FlgB